MEWDDSLNNKPEFLSRWPHNSRNGIIFAIRFAAAILASELGHVEVHTHISRPGNPENAAIGVLSWDQNGVLLLLPIRQCKIALFLWQSTESHQHFMWPFAACLPASVSANFLAAMRFVV